MCIKTTEKARNEIFPGDLSLGNSDMTIVNYFAPLCPAAVWLLSVVDVIGTRNVRHSSDNIDHQWRIS